MPDKCLTPRCGKPAGPSFKGLCIKCYSSAKKLVDAGHTTWEALESVGLAKLTRDDDPFMQAYKDKLLGE